MEIVKDTISIAELKKMSEKMFGGLVKAVVDIEQEIMAIDAELHGDLESLLLANGSQQDYLWGINIYPEQIGTKGFIIFDSMINIRPDNGNRGVSVENPQIRQKIMIIVNRLVVK